MLYTVSFTIEIDAITKKEEFEGIYENEINSLDIFEKERVLKELAKRMYLDRMNTENLLEYFATEDDDGKNYNIELKEY